MKLYFIILLTTASFLSFSQEERKVELRFPSEQVPEKAKNYIMELFPNAKTKWVREFNSTEDKLQAKLKYKGNRISVEFTRKGDFEDLEEQVSFSDMNSDAVKKITEKLTTDFEEIEFKKIQHHYSGDKDEILKNYKTRSVNIKFISHRFEIVVYGINNKQIHSYEYTFTLDGSFVERFENIESNSDNLLF